MFLHQNCAKIGEKKAIAHVEEQTPKQRNYSLPLILRKLLVTIGWSIHNY